MVAIGRFLLPTCSLHDRPGWECCWDKVNQAGKCGIEAPSGICVNLS